MVTGGNRSPSLPPPCHREFNFASLSRHLFDGTLLHRRDAEILEVVQLTFAKSTNKTLHRKLARANFEPALLSYLDVD